MPLKPNLYHTASNQELFAELERLTILCDNVSKTLFKLEAQDNVNPSLTRELRIYLTSQLQLKTELRKFILATRAC